MPKKALIIGQGIAGSLLGYLLIQKKYQITIVDNNHKSSSTKAAAGLINPITGKRFVESKDFLKYYEFAKEFYENLEGVFKTPFFFERSIIRFLLTDEEHKSWQNRKNKLSNPPLWLEENLLDSANNFFKTPENFFLTKKSGNCNIAGLIRYFKEYFKEHNSLVNEDFNYSDIEITDQKIRYKNIDFDFIVFCEGYKADKNPFFSKLPFLHAKGEILTLHIDNYKNSPYIYNYGKWLLPLGNYEYKTGATYCWDILNEVTTQKAKEEILSPLKNFLKHPFQIKNHVAGVRPIMKDQKPVLGQHPKHKQIYIFNGLGSKGALLGPYFAHQLANLINEQTPIDDEVSIQRFQKEFK